jgi:hypothetical protein
MKFRLLSTICAVLFYSTVNAAAPVVKDAGGRILGYYGGPADIGDNYGQGYRVTSAAGYVFAIHSWDSEFVRHTASHTGRVFLPEVHFTSTDCSGQGYAVYQVGSPLSGGFVTRMDGGQIYYSPKYATTDQISARSKLSGGNCQTFAFQNYPGIAILPNDPEVTAVPNDIPTGVPEIVITTVGSDLFEDGFEQVT